MTGDGGRGDGGGDLRVDERVVLPAAELVYRASRSGGPGGQHVNKVESRVTLRWNLEESGALDARQKARVRGRLGARLTNAGELLVHAQQHRSQAANRALAGERLAELLRDALRPVKRRKRTRPTRASRERRLQEKARRGKLKRERSGPAGDGA